MKRTNIVLNQKLVREGLKSTGLKTRRALVEHALQELVRREVHRQGQPGVTIGLSQSLVVQKGVPALIDANLAPVR